MYKQLSINKQGGVLEATYRWRSPKAYLLAFFCVLWDGFLIYYYSSNLSAESTMALFFPLIHVAVGIGLTYYTLCLLFNVSYFRVDRERLTIRHRPLPWWGGDWNIPVDAIQQLFVKRRKRKNKRGVSYTYGIRVVKTDGEAATLFNVYTPYSQDMHQLEIAIEEQLNIVDRPMQDEYRDGKSTVAATTDDNLVSPRSIDATSDGHAPSLGQLRSDDYLRLRGKEYQVVHHIQYDWNEGTSDLLLQLSGAAGPTGLYLAQVDTVHRAYETRQLEAAEQARFPLSPQSPPPTFTNGADAYRLLFHQQGHFFPDHLRHRGGIPIEQWIYGSDTAARFRYVHYQGMTELYIEEAVGAEAIERVERAD